MNTLPDDVTSERTRALAYYRISDDPSESGRSIERQQGEAHQTAVREGVTIAPTDEFQDTDSASIFGIERGVVRDDWDRMIATLNREGATIHMVILSEMSRGTREQVEYQNLAQACRRHNVVINVKGRNFDPEDAADDFQLGLEVLLAQQEARRISNRSRKGIAGSIRNGRAPAGRVPFGFYRPPRDPGEPVTQYPHERNAKAVEAAAKAIVAGDKNLGDIEREWNALAAEDRKQEMVKLAELAKLNKWSETDREYTRRVRAIERRNKWNRQSVRKALMNPALIGRRKVGKDTVQGNWEGILSEELYYALYATLTDSERRTSPGPTSNTLLAAIGVCGVCGERLRTKDKYYTCRKSNCVMKSRDWCDTLAVEALNALLCAKIRDEMSSEIRGYDPAVTNAEEFERAQKELQAARDTMTEFQSEAAKSGLTPAAVVATLRGYEENVESAQRKVEALAKTQTREADPLTEQVKARIEALELARLEFDTERRDMTPLVVTMTFHDHIVETAREMLESAELPTRRRWLKDGFTITLNRTPSNKRVDVMNPATLQIIPRTGWDAIGDSYRPWWTKPGNAGTVNGVVVRISGEAPKPNRPKRDA
ncbi:recombinase family protein [Amycolatopsis nalaikhensis]|uniref:Recombinase family protein n=1 Tax=Amycolatopsis nalaikhensis TaxID=715472 RepID=A0ABY8XP78_9PSEU|nr:recombinase family protein [Amycolatopsis sp. 2-2]WIV57434.1 recombinase family protein [Amycolatopsis sp. 2-2]